MSEVDPPKSFCLHDPSKAFAIDAIGDVKRDGGFVWFELSLGQKGIELRIEIPDQSHDCFCGTIWLASVISSSLNGAGAFDDPDIAEAFAACLEAEAAVIRATIRRGITIDAYEDEIEKAEERLESERARRRSIFTPSRN